MLTFLTSLYYITQVDYCLQYENSHILDASSQWLFWGFFVQKGFEVATGKKQSVIYQLHEATGELLKLDFRIALWRLRVHVLIEVPTGN